MFSPEFPVEGQGVFLTDVSLRVIYPYIGLDPSGQVDITTSNLKTGLKKGPLALTFSPS
jgi:hypothetical protein